MLPTFHNLFLQYSTFQLVLTFANADVAKIRYSVESFLLNDVQGTVLLWQNWELHSFNLKTGKLSQSLIKKMNAVIPYPTVVMEMNENQKPSPAPFENDLDKPSDFQLESLSERKTKRTPCLVVNPWSLMASKASGAKASYWLDVVISNEQEEEIWKGNLVSQKRK